MGIVGFGFLNPEAWIAVFVAFCMVMATLG
jgi:hypothetical protein